MSRSVGRLIKVEQVIITSRVGNCSKAGYLHIVCRHVKIEGQDKSRRERVGVRIKYAIVSDAFGREILRNKERSGILQRETRRASTDDKVVAAQSRRCRQIIQGIVNRRLALA